MSKDDLVKRLEQISRDHRGDPEASHAYADDALLEFIGDSRVTEWHKLLAIWCA